MDRDWFWVCFIGTAFGTVFVFHEILLRDFGPVAIAFGRLAIGAVASWAFVLLTAKKWRLPKDKLGLFVLAAIFTLFIPFLAFPVGQQYVGAGMTGIVNSTTPAFTVILSQFWPGGERVNRYKALGVLAGMIGIFVLTLPALEAGAGSQLKGIVILLAAPMSFAVALNLARYVYVVHPSVLATWIFTFGAILVFPILLLTEGLPTSVNASAWAPMMIAAIALTALPYHIAYNILPSAGPMKVASLTYIAPVVALLLGTILLGERLQSTHYLGMLVILIGLFLIDRGRSIAHTIN